MHIAWWRIFISVMWKYVASLHVVSAIADSVAYRSVYHHFTEICLRSVILCPLSYRNLLYCFVFAIGCNTFDASLFCRIPNGIVVISTLCATIFAIFEDAFVNIRCFLLSSVFHLEYIMYRLLPSILYLIFATHNVIFSLFFLCYEYFEFCCVIFVVFF